MLGCGRTSATRPAPGMKIVKMKQGCAAPHPAQEIRRLPEPRKLTDPRGDRHVGWYAHGMSSSCRGPGLSSSNYDVTPDGQRFLIIDEAEESTIRSHRIMVVLGWADELERRSSRA